MEWIPHAQLDDAPVSQYKPPQPTPREVMSGTNKVWYWVTSEPGRPWVKLPSVSPHHISVARKIKKLMSGNLDAPVHSYPPFQVCANHVLLSFLLFTFFSLSTPLFLFSCSCIFLFHTSKHTHTHTHILTNTYKYTLTNTHLQIHTHTQGSEKHLLRAQIARITAATVVSPVGYFAFPEDQDEEEDDRMSIEAVADYEGAWLMRACRWGVSAGVRVGVGVRLHG